jgi:hypothetical protein
VFFEEGLISMRRTSVIVHYMHILIYRLASSIFRKFFKETLFTYDCYLKKKGKSDGST